MWLGRRMLDVCCSSCGIGCCPKYRLMPAPSAVIAFVGTRYVHGRASPYARLATAVAGARRMSLSAASHISFDQSALAFCFYPHRSHCTIWLLCTWTLTPRAASNASTSCCHCQTSHQKHSPTCCCCTASRWVQAATAPCTVARWCLVCCTPDPSNACTYAAM